MLCLEQVAVVGRRNFISRRGAAEAAYGLTGIEGQIMRLKLIITQTRPMLLLLLLLRIAASRIGRHFAEDATFHYRHDDADRGSNLAHNCRPNLNACQTFAGLAKATFGCAEEQKDGSIDCESARKTNSKVSL